ncbi:hypothetical protein KKC59_03170, partial [bacterium]|nr:hypothetical protein [bacterium]
GEYEDSARVAEIQSDVLAKTKTFFETYIVEQVLGAEGAPAYKFAPMVSCDEAKSGLDAVLADNVRSELKGVVEFVCDQKGRAVVDYTIKQELDAPAKMVDGKVLFDARVLLALFKDGKVDEEVLAVLRHVVIHEVNRAALNIFHSAGDLAGPDAEKAITEELDLRSADLENYKEMFADDADLAKLIAGWKALYDDSKLLKTEHNGVSLRLDTVFEQQPGTDAFNTADRAQLLAAASA